MQNIYSNSQQTYPYVQTCIIIVVCHSDLPVHTDIDSFIWVFSFYRHSSQKLVQANISFSLSWPAQTKPSTGTFSNPYKITYPYKQTFTFLYRSLHRPTCSQGHLILTDIFHTGLLAHINVFQPQSRPTQASLSIWTFFFSLTWPTQAFSPTQTLSRFCRGLHRPACPHGHFFLTDVANTGLLVHTDVFFPLLQPAQVYLTYRRCLFFTVIAYVDLQREIQPSL